MSLNCINNPSSCIGTSSGGLIVLNSTGTITEYDQDGLVTVIFDASAMALGDNGTLTLNYDTNNLLISGGNIPMVSEIGVGRHRSRNGSVELFWFVIFTNWGAVYGDGLETILFCDSGNGSNHRY